MATIRDIARLTGYSITTVSRVINHHPYVAESKREKVLQVMAELNYTPNQTAQNLSTGKTRNLGVILPFVDHPFYNQMLSGILSAAFNEQYKVTLLPTNYSREQEKVYLAEFAAKAFDGLIVITRANEVSEFQPYFTYGPIIFCEQTDLVAAPYVSIDLAGSLRASTEYLLAQGVQRLGVTLGRQREMSGNSQVTISTLQEIYPDFQTDFIFWDCFEAEDGQEAAAFFSAQGVDGILTSGDEVAAEIIRHWPQEQALPLVVGRENLLISQVMGFATVDHQLYACGKRAFDLFQEEEVAQIVMPFKLLIH